jgi:hypothetical protein
MSLCINVLVKKHIQILATKPKSYDAFHHRGPSSPKTDAVRCPIQRNRRARLFHRRGPSLLETEERLLAIAEFIPRSKMTRAGLFHRRSQPPLETEETRFSKPAQNRFQTLTTVRWRTNSCRGKQSKENFQGDAEAGIIHCLIAFLFFMNVMFNPLPFKGKLWKKEFSVIPKSILPDVSLFQITLV